MADKSFSQKNIAEELGISAVTVSNALRGKDGVSDELRAAILNAAERNGYRVAAVNKKDRQQSRTVGILIPERYISIGTSFYWEMYQSTVFRLSQRSILSSLEILTDMEEEDPLPGCVLDEDMDGVIIIGRLNRPYMNRVLEAAGSRCVLMDCYYPGYGCSAVLSSNYVGMYRSTQYLVDHGHREIGFVGTPETSGNVADRFYGYRRCLSDNGLEYHPEWFIRDRIPGTEELVMNLPERLPTAFASSSDYAAGALADHLEERGLHIPEDVSVASYDDYLYDHPLGKILTTFHVDMDRMAEEAVTLLEESRNNRKGERLAVDGRVIYVDGHVVERASVRNL